uniref:C3H1-type domain-containing protein n=1 Tax=Haemonchus contortus TaxID=6289 RepID=A0A6F7PG39_HAECO|nr:Zinc finger domain containing protein [Haemonchus contortus]
MHIENVEEFTSWLIAELTPVCDAEPGTLAKYVLALLRKPNKSDEEMRAFSSSQLEVFLQGNTKKFVDKMFAVLKDGSYVPKKEPSPIPEDVVKERVAKREEVRKKEREVVETKPSRESGRNGDHSDDRRKAVPEKTPKKEDVPPPVRNERPPRKRISPPPNDNVKRDVRDVIRDGREPLREPRRRSRSRSPRDRRGRLGARRSPNDRFRGDRRRTRSQSGGRSRSPERRDRRSPRIDERRKRRCRDYDEKGYCMQGDHCVFDHGPDPVVVDDSALEKMVKIPEKPASHNFTIPPPGYHPPNPPPPGVEPIFTGPPPGPRPVEGYNPEAPSLSGPDFSMPPPPLPVPLNTTPWRPSPYAVPTTANVVVPTIGYDPSGGIPVDPSSAAAVPRQPIMRGGMRGRGRGGPATGRFPQVSNNRGDGKTLQVKKIPPEFNNIAKLNEHFATFGSIVNMQVRFNGEPDSALISYASRHEAMAAYKSPQPVLNNRFIKVFFYNPDAVAGSTAGQDGVQRSVLNSGVNVDKPASEGAPVQPPQPPKPVVTIENSKFVNKELKETREKIIEARRKLKAEKAAQFSLFNVHKRQTDLLQKLVDRQKAVVLKLKTEADTLDPTEKKKLLGVVKKMMDKITAGRKEIHELSAKLKSCTEHIAELEKEIASEKSAGKEKSSENDRDSASPSSPNQEGKVAVVPTQNLLKRKAEDGGDVDAKRQSAVIAVKRFKLGDTDALVEHMGQFGEIMNIEVIKGKDPKVLLTFRNREDADQAIVEGGLFKGTMLDVTWHWRSDGSRENSPLSADKMLASIPQSESDDEL